MDPYAEYEEDITEAFSIYGSQGDMTIPTTAFGTVMRALGLNPTERELDELRKEADPDNAGTITIDQFKPVFYKKKSDSDTFPELMEAFRIFDSLSSGTIRVPEFRYIMSCLGEKIAEEDVDDVVKAADPDGTGEVKYEEFAKKIWDKKDL